MRKSDEQYYLTSKEEHRILLYEAKKAIKLLATIHIAEDPLPNEELKSISNQNLLVDGIVNFTDVANLKKKWKKVDWELDTAELASLIASCGNKEIIKQAPLNWDKIPTPLVAKRVEYVNSEPLWLAQTMVKDRNIFFEHLSRSHKSSLANRRAQKSFWDGLLEDGKITQKTKLSCADYNVPEKISLFQMALLHDNYDLCKRFPLSKSINNKDEAEVSMLCALGHDTYDDYKTNKYTARLLNRCLKFNPDLGRIFERKSKLENWHNILMANNGLDENGNQVEKANFVRESMYSYNYSNIDWEDEKKISLREVLFLHLNDVDTELNSKAVEYLVKDIKSLSTEEQENFVGGIIKRLEIFPFNDLSLSSKVIEVLEPEIQKNIFKDHIKNLWGDNFGKEMIECFVKANVKFDRDVLEDCANFYLEDSRARDIFKDDVICIFPDVFNQDTAHLADGLAKVLSSSRTTEKSEIATSLWLKDFKEDRNRPRKSTRRI